jgi:hypothetical protein
VDAHTSRSGSSARPGFKDKRNALEALRNSSVVSCKSLLTHLLTHLLAQPRAGLRDKSQRLSLVLVSLF